MRYPLATLLTIMSWNVESGGADAVTIACQIAAFDGVDLWGLSEVNGDDDPRATEILDTACAQLRRRAAIDDPQRATMFWQLDDHRFFQKVAACAD